MIALERAEVRRPIPRRSIQRVEEGRVDSKHVDDLFQHLECTCNMLMAPCAKVPMLSKKSLCTREFAVCGKALGQRQAGYGHGTCVFKSLPLCFLQNRDCQAR